MRHRPNFRPHICCFFAFLNSCWVPEGRQHVRSTGGLRAGLSRQTVGLCCSEVTDVCPVWFSDGFYLLKFHCEAQLLRLILHILFKIAGNPVAPVLAVYLGSCVVAAWWCELRLSSPFNPPPLHMTSLWCTSQRKPSLVRCVFSCVTCSLSELLGTASTPTGRPVVERVRTREREDDVVGFYEWKHGGEETRDGPNQILTDPKEEDILFIFLSCLYLMFSV